MIATADRGNCKDAGRGDFGNKVSRLIVGQRLTITAGVLQGLRGELVERRPPDAIVLRIAAGAYVEISKSAVSG